MKLTPEIIERVGKLRASGKSIAEVRDEMDINETQATRAWKIYREANGLAVIKPGNKSRTS